MILGYERLQRHSDLDWGYWNYNGRYQPSTLALDPDQVNRELPARHAEVYKMVCDPHNWPLHHSQAYAWSNILFHDTPYNDRIDRRCVQDLGDEPYIYPIIIKTISVFLRYTSHVSISERVRQDVLKGQAAIVFVYHLEGTVRHYKAQFDALVKQMNLPRQSIYLLHGDHDLDFFKNSPYIYCATNCFPFRIFKLWTRDPVNYQPGQLFLTYNRQPRPHRLLLLHKLCQRDLLDHALISCGTLNEETVWHDLVHNYNLKLNQTEIGQLLALSGRSPDQLTLNPADIDSYNPANNLCIEHYRSTFVSLITETLTDGLFFSEKIYKPIMIGHPFLLLGAPGQLKQLREWGYQTFSAWWDESYDLETDCAKRMDKIIDILVWLSHQSPHQLVEMRQQMQPVLSHNRAQFRKYTWDCEPDLRDNLYNAIAGMIPR